MMKKYSFLVLIIIALVIGCDNDKDHSKNGQIGRVSGERQLAQRDLERKRAAERERQQKKDEMIHRVNGIIQNIGSAENCLLETESTVREEMDMLGKIKQNAKTAYLGGQMSDFRTWQRIGREKKANIKHAARKVENTIFAARQGAESELQRVNWVSSGYKEQQLNHINQRLSKLRTWKSTIERISGDLAEHDTWLDANE